MYIYIYIYIYNYTKTLRPYGPFVLVVACGQQRPSASQGGFALPPPKQVSRHSKTPKNIENIKIFYKIC